MKANELDNTNHTGYICKVSVQLPIHCRCYWSDLMFK
jgi:hypothetical protein